MWQRVASLPRANLAQPYSDWTYYIGPEARSTLENAVRALSPRQAAALRERIERADVAYCAKTLNNPWADPAQPWWSRRWAP